MLKRLFSTSLYNNSFYLMLNTVVISVLGYPFWIVVARYYKSEDVGFISAILSLVSIIVMISMFGLDSSVVRYLSKSPNPKQLINSSFIVGGGISIIISLIAILGINIWCPSLIYVRESIVLFIVVLLIVCLSVISNLIDNVFIALRKTQYICIKNTVFSIIKLVFPILLCVALPTYGIIIAYVCSLFVAVILALFILLPKILNKYCLMINIKSIKTSMKGVWLFSGGNYIANLLLAIPNLLFPVMVINVLGSSSNAYFYIGWILASFLFSVAYAVALSFFAESSSNENKFIDNSIKTIRLTYLVLIPCMIVMIVFGRWILSLFGQEYLGNSYSLLIILSLSSLAVALRDIYISVLRFNGNIKEIIIISCIIAVSILIGSYILLPINGITGIGYIYALIHLILVGYIIIFRRSKLLGDSNHCRIS